MRYSTFNCFSSIVPNRATEKLHTVQCQRFWLIFLFYLLPISPEYELFSVISFKIIIIFKIFLYSVKLSERELIIECPAFCMDIFCNVPQSSLCQHYLQMCKYQELFTMILQGMLCKLKTLYITQFVGIPRNQHKMWF